MRHYINSIFLVAVLALAFSTHAQSRVLLDKVVAVVNDDVITLRELEETENKINKTTEQQLSRDQALEQLIERKLIEQQAEKIGVSVSDAEVEATMDVLRQRYNLQGDEMQEALKQQNMTEEEFKEQWKYQLLTKKVMDNKLKGKIAVTDEEIKEYYTENFGQIESADEVRISQILLKDESEANNVAELARSGEEDFSELAKRYSTDEVSAPVGGDLGYFKKGDLIEQLANAVESAEVGEVAGPVETQAGYHILKVTDRKSADEGLPESTKLEIRERLYNQKVQKVLEQWLTEVKDNAYIDRKI